MSAEPFNLAMEHRVFVAENGAVSRLESYVGTGTEMFQQYCIGRLSLEGHFFMTWARMLESRRVGTLQEILKTSPDLQKKCVLLFASQNPSEGEVAEMGFKGKIKISKE